MTENNGEVSNKKLKQILGEKTRNLRELEKNGKNSEYIMELSDIALIQLELGQFLKAEKNYMTCLNHFEKQKDRLGQAAVYGVLGTLFFKKHEYLKSNEYYEIAYKIYRDLMQIQEQITCLIGIGNSFIELNNLDEASDVFFKCSAICADNNDIYSLLDCLGRLIYINEKKEEWDIVFELYKKVLKSFKELKDSKGMINSYFNLGILQKKNNKLGESLRYFKKGTNVAIDSNLAELIIKGLGYIGEIYFYLGDTNEAKNQFIRALYIANNIKADNAKLQLQILLQTLGLQENHIRDELQKYEKSRKNIN
ncbi:MAG: tetratricopeptide repeat protein [Promethearchaeota archaeon]